MSLLPNGFLIVLRSKKFAFSLVTVGKNPLHEIKSRINYMRAFVGLTNHNSRLPLEIELKWLLDKQQFSLFTTNSDSFK